MKLMLTATALALVFLTGSLGLPAVPTVEAPAATPTWSPAATAWVNPGVQTNTGGSQCTANFVFYDDLGGGEFDIYIGQAAHCASLGGPTQTNGCTTPTMDLGTTVILNGIAVGTMEYSSWVEMQDNGETNPTICQYNDFALIKLAESYEAKTSPQVPHFGGPIGLFPVSTAFLGLGDSVMSYGNSGLRFGIQPVLSWKEGYVISSSAWTTTVYTVTPGIPGDSGSGFMDHNGYAFGTLSTVAIAPFPLSNGVGSLPAEVAYMEANGGPDVELATAPLIFGSTLPPL